MRLWRRKPKGRVFILIHNRNHVNIMRGVASELLRDRVAAQWMVFPGRIGADQATQALLADGITALNAKQMLDQLGPGDVMVYLLRGHLRDPDRMPELQARGVRLLQVVEGARFNLEKVAHPLVPLLGWGPSVAIKGGITRVVGSPILEAVRPGPALDQRAPMALINYKFRGFEGDHAARAPWLAAALAACEAAGYDPVLSGHPMLDEFPAGVTISARPVADLCAEARVVISRPSTVVHEALLAGAQPFVLALPDEDPVEFATPQGAFGFTTQPAELTAQMLDWQAGRQTYDARAFLEAHVDIDPKRPATARIAAEILADLRRTAAR